LSNLSINTVAIDCASLRVASEFWAALLAMKVTFENDHWLELEPLGPAGPVLAFQLVPERKAVKNRIHFDIDVPNLGEAVANARALGATLFGEVVTTPAMVYQVMRDPEGNEFCLVERKKQEN
jgi:predicted enzyme related to lactoylglutathione lyase